MDDDRTRGSGPPTGGLGSQGGLADLPTHQSHRFRLAEAEPVRHDGGQLQHANEETFPIVAGHDVSMVRVCLEPGGVREPHWHPSAWEVHHVVAGTARFSLLETLGYQEHFEASAGDVVFLPQGGIHYFENTSDSQDYEALLVFNTSAREPRDDIGLVAALNVFPHDVLGTVFGADPSTFAPLPRVVEPVTIVRRPRTGRG